MRDAVCIIRNIKSGFLCYTNIKGAKMWSPTTTSHYKNEESYVKPKDYLQNAEGNNRTKSIFYYNLNFPRFSLTGMGLLESP